MPGPDAGQGLIVVTRFECPNLAALLVILVLHGRIKRQVARVADGYLGATMRCEWRNRTVFSISMWRDLDSVYAMGQVPRHILAARLPGRLGIRTRAGMFSYAGDWRNLMFGATDRGPSPLEESAGGRSARHPAGKPASQK